MNDIKIEQKLDINYVTKIFNETVDKITKEQNNELLVNHSKIIFNNIVLKLKLIQKLSKTNQMMYYGYSTEQMIEGILNDDKDIIDLIKNRL